MKGRIKVYTGMGGLYRLGKHKADADGKPVPGSFVPLTGWFHNLITDQGLDRPGTEGDYLAACQVGSGNTTPVNADTSLEVWVAGVTNITGTSRTARGSPPYYASITLTYRFGVGVAAGNLSEVGIGWATSGATLFSRALILDGGGSPTTITVLSDEILDVQYQYRVYPMLTDVEDTITISGDNYDYVVRSSSVTTVQPGAPTYWGGWGWSQIVTDAALKGAYIYAASGTLGPITAGPSASGAAQADSSSTAAYVPGSHERSASAVWGITRAPAGGCGFVSFGFGWCTYKASFDPVIPKTGANVLTLEFIHSWGRATIP